MENLKTSKQYYVPMEITGDTIRDFDIDAATVQWMKIGNRKVRAVMIPVRKEQYYEFMRPLWREEKRNQRLAEKQRKREAAKDNPELSKKIKGVDTLVSLEYLLEFEYKFEADADVEADVEKK